jgi:predicted N-acyltransferase/multidrug transporter EmrE-like cation transporter
MTFAMAFDSTAGSGAARVLSRAAAAAAILGSPRAESGADYRHYWIVEDTIRDGILAYHYLALYDDAQNVRTVQPCFVVDQDLVLGAPRAVRELAAIGRRRFPRFLVLRTLMLGCAAGEGRLLCDPTIAPVVAAQLHAALPAAARELGASLIVLKEFPPSSRRAMSCMTRNGFARLPSFPMARLWIGYRDFDEYAARALGHCTRKGLRRKLRRAESLGPIEMQVVTDVAPYVDEVYPLYLQVYERAALRFEKLTPDYLLRLGRDMPDHARFFIWRLAGRAVAFSVCTVDGDTIRDLYLGMDYAVALDLHLYFYTFRGIVAWAMERGVNWYCSTSLGYDPKLHLGCDLLPLDLYVRHRSDTVNFFLKRLLPWLDPTRRDKTLLLFPNYHEVHGDPPPSRMPSAPKPPPSRAGGFLNPYVQIGVGALLTTVSELMLKLGATATAGAGSLFGVAALASPWTWGGIVTYILSFVSWLYVLRRLPLGIAFALINVVHVLVPLAAWQVLGESVTPRRWAGIALILVGILMVARTLGRAEEVL